MFNKKKKDEEINFLPEKGFEASTAGRLLTWVLSTFRIIVIVTEIIVMVAFLSRFWLDAQNTDLNDEIKQKQAVIASSLTFEREFKDAQKRIKIYKDTVSREILYQEALSAMTSYLPPDLFLVSITLSKDAVDFQGSSPNEVSIQQLLVNLEGSEKFNDISLSELSLNKLDSSLFDFKVKSQLKTSQTQTQ